MSDWKLTYKGVEAPADFAFDIEGELNIWARGVDAALNVDSSSEYRYYKEDTNLDDPHPVFWRFRGESEKGESYWLEGEGWAEAGRPQSWVDQYELRIAEIELPAYVRDAE